MPRPRSATRVAKVYTWQPSQRVERMVRRCRLPVSGDARDLIRGAAALVAPLRPWRVSLMVVRHRRILDVRCETDEHGVQTHVSVTLHPPDVVALLTYFARDRSVACLLFVDLPDDGDGEDLAVPCVSVDELARMPVPAIELVCDAPKGGA
jgi:hypothetical protein